MRNPQIEYSLNKHVPSEPHWIVVESAFSQFVIMTYLQVMCIYIYMQLFDYLLRILLLIWQYIHIYNTFAYIILIFSISSHKTLFGGAQPVMVWNLNGLWEDGCVWLVSDRN